MNPDGIEELAHTINDRAEDYEIGELQDIRTEIQGKQKVRSDIFDPKTIIDDYAYHWGGRTEPQFNLAYRQYNGEKKIRYGIGISLQDSQWAGESLDEWADDLMGAMRPRIRLFNEYLTAHPEEFAGLKLWYEPEGSTVPEGDYPASPIPESFVAENHFIFLGKRKKPSEISYDNILTVFDRLLPLYEFIESNIASEFASQGISEPPAESASSQNSQYKNSFQSPQTEIERRLEHERIQDALERELISDFGQGRVHREYPTEHEGRVDLVVERGNGKWFYEIKPYDTPRKCLREAIGQLLEYAYWSGSEAPERLIVVGRSELGEEGEAYLSTLKEEGFSLPLEYQSPEVE